MAKPKDTKSKSAPDGTKVAWGIKFWFGNERTKSRWTEGRRVFIHNVTLRIKLNGAVLWESHGVGTQLEHIQPVLNTLAPNLVYELELELPPDDPCASRMAAGPHSGRATFEELPPLKRWDVWDVQLRRGSVGFIVERIAAPIIPGIDVRIVEVRDMPYDKHSRPPVLRGVLLFDKKRDVSHLDLDWRPDWLRRARTEKNGKLVLNIIPRNSYSYYGGSATHIVLHSTGGLKNTVPPAQIGGAIAQLTASWDKKGKSHWRGIHYMIDYDGHVVKMAADSVATGHAGGSEWRGGGTSLNNLAVGIEHVHHGQDTSFPPEQTAASLDLVQRLTAHFGIDPRHVVGHGEVRTIRTDDAEELAKVNVFIKKHYTLSYQTSWGKALHPNDRLTSCPGGEFEWHEYAARGLIPDVFNAPEPPGWKATAFFKYFEVVGAKPLRRLDVAVDAEDVQKIMLVLGGEKQSDRTLMAAGQEMIRSLHVNLRVIGYSIPGGGYNRDDLVFQWPLHLAIIAFQLKFVLPQARQALKLKLGEVDQLTAKTVLQAATLYA